MSFLAYDLTLLILFAIFVAIFLITKRRNLKREGLLFLYKTKWGMKFIDHIGRKYKKTLHFLSYVSITLGYLLMAGILYVVGKLIWVYLFHPNIVRAIKIPPITPLIPYLPQVFKLDFLPPFYFIYWILILAIIAVTHEFAHGIFMRRYDIKIKSTGFGFFPYFFPIFQAAFVEQEEKSMLKANKFKQMAVLSAGTFANTITAVVVFLITLLFFSLAFSPQGVTFDSYSYTEVAIASIALVNGVPIDNSNYQNVLTQTLEEGLNEIENEEGVKYLATPDMLKQQEENSEKVILYHDAPAIRNGLLGAIHEINGVKIKSFEQVGEELSNYPPGEEITIKTKFDSVFVKSALESIDSEAEVEEEGLITEHKIVLGKNPQNPEKAWLGVGFFETNQGGLSGKIFGALTSFKKPHVYYESNIGDLGIFIYNFLWWLILISISVALVNMLPVGIFDGGRFFYLTILGITGKEKWAEKSYVWITKVFLLIVVLLMVFWGLSFF